MTIIANNYRWRIVIPLAASPSTPSTANTEGNGTELGAYSFRLTNGYAAPLAASAPTQGQITQTSASYDIDFNGQIYPGSNERMISLTSGSKAGP